MREPSPLTKPRIWALLVAGLSYLRPASKTVKIPHSQTLTRQVILQAQGVVGGGGVLKAVEHGIRTYGTRKESVPVTDHNTSVPQPRPHDDLKSRRFMYCFGEGGLNDIFTQLMRCVQYAKTSGRELWMDHRLYQAPTGYDRYFSLDVIPGARIGGFGRAFYHKDMSVYPSWYALDREVELKYQNTSVGFGAGLNFTRSSDEDVVVHRNCGGSLLSAELVPFLLLSSEVAGTVKSRHEVLGGAGQQYLAVHSRSPQSRMCKEVPDLDHLINDTKVHAEMHSTWPIFVATDNGEALQRFRESFGPSRIISFATIPADTRGEVHRSFWLPAKVRHQTNIDAFADLFLLALADVLVTSCGGYSKLAGRLHSDKPTVTRIVGLATL